MEAFDEASGVVVDHTVARGAVATVVADGGPSQALVDHQDRPVHQAHPDRVAFVADLGTE